MRRRPYAHGGNVLRPSRPTLLEAFRLNVPQGSYVDIHGAGTPRIYFPPAPTAMQIRALAGGEANTSGGTGVNTVRLWLLGSDYEYSELVVAMNGISAVQLPGGPYLRCNFIRTETVGTDQYPSGADIVVETLGGANELRRLPVGVNRSQDGGYTVPADEVMHLSRITFSLSDQKESDIARGRGEFRPDSSAPWYGIDTIRSMVLEDPATEFTVPPPGLFRLPPRADIRFSILTEAANTDVGMQALFIF